MGSQKIPLFDGVMLPVNPATPTTIFTPPDKNLPDGTQAFYEVHLWLIPQGDAADVYLVSAIEDGDPAGTPVWIGTNATAGPFQVGLPIKVLDGYPVRGDVTLEALVTSVGTASFVYGYYYRVGQGDVRQPARRYIGETLTGINAGVPIPFAAGEKKVIHTFAAGRIDEISLALMWATSEEAAPSALLRFEDANGALVVGTAPVLIVVSPVPDYRRNPPSPYNFYQAVFGGSPAKPTLAQLAVEAVAPGEDFQVHGYFTRY